MHQELIEILYHTLWETVHVFFERRELGHDVGEASFLYPFLGQEKQDSSGVLNEVAASIQMKVQEDAKLRAQVAERGIGTASRKRRSRFASGSHAAASSSFSATEDRRPMRTIGRSIAFFRLQATSLFRRFRFRWSPPTSRRWRTTSVRT